MFNPQQELASPDQTVSGKDSSNLLMADNLPKILWYSTHHVTLMKSWLVQKQTTLGKEKSNPLTVNSLLKTIWSSIHQLLINEVLTIPGQTATGVNTTRCDEDRLELTELTVFLLPKVDKVRIGVSAIDLQVFAVRLMLLLLVQKFLLFGLTNWCCSLSTVREVLCLDDAEGVDCLPNKEIFTELARIRYEKPSTKLTFYKAFFSSRWKFLIHTILQCMSAKQTSWNEFSSSMAFAVICLSTGDLLTHTTKHASPTLTQKHKRLRKKEMQMSILKMLLLVMMLMEMILLLMEKFLLLLKNHPYHLLPYLLYYHNHLKISLQHLRYNKLHHNHLRRVEHLEYDKVAQALEITKLKRRVKKLKKENKVRVLKPRRLQKVGTSQRVDTSDDTVIDDESNQGRMIAEMDNDDAVVLMDDKEEDKKVEEAKVVESAQV
nr:hypothetical protein [Tanacetum cinerariifolium]